VSQCFAKAFQQPSGPLIENSSVEEFVFEVTLEVREEGSGVPRDGSSFKLRVDQEKELSLTVQQVSGNQRQLDIERCFGVLVAPGRNVKHSDMQLLEMVCIKLKGSGCYMKSRTAIYYFSSLSYIM